MHLCCVLLLILFVIVLHGELVPAGTRQDDIVKNIQQSISLSRKDSKGSISNSSISSSSGSSSSSDSASTTQRFLGRTFTTHEWRHIKSVVKCWGAKGFWKLNPHLYNFPKNVSIDEFALQVQQVSPCFNPLLPAFYGRSGFCHWVLDTDALRYQWQLTQGSCHGFDTWYDFSTDRLCDIMRGQSSPPSYQQQQQTQQQPQQQQQQHSRPINVMIAGDSMNEHFSLALRSISYQGSDKPKPDTSLCNSYKPDRAFRLPCYLSTAITTATATSTTVARKESIGLSSGNDAVRIYTRRNDLLSLTKKTTFDEALKLRQSDWTSQLSALNVSLLVLNRGAHYEPDAKLLSDVNRTLSFLRQQHPHISIIWRNTPFGHLDYRKMSGSAPLSAPPPRERLLKYNYNSFERQNALVEQLLEAWYPEVLHMDVFTATVLRADSHSDPLHYCMPGPVYNWVHFLFNVLLLIDEFHHKSQHAAKTSFAKVNNF